MAEYAVEYLEEVRCRGCRRLVGIAPRDYVIYCDEQCANDFPAIPDEARNALIEAMWQSNQFPTKAALAAHVGFSRQRIDQILRDRDLTAV